MNVEHESDRPQRTFRTRLDLPLLVIHLECCRDRRRADIVRRRRVEHDVGVNALHLVPVARHSKVGIERGWEIADERAL
jgi:hypothetical protein